MLIKATDILVFHLKALARKTELGGFFLTSIVVGLATSLPEILVGITSALEGQPNISLGNVIGSNIADLSLVAGLAAFLGGSLNIRGKSHTTDFIHAFMAGIAPFILLLDHNLSRVDGFILIALYGFYNFLILRERNKEMTEQEDGGFIAGLLRKIRRNHTGRNFRYVFLGLAMMLFAADMIVKIGLKISEGIGIPVLLVGLFLVAVGTSLPELAFELKAVRRKESAMFVGNLLGSVVANGTLVIGLTAVIYPIEIRAFSEYTTASLFFIAVCSFFYFFIRSKQRLERWEGFVLLAIYILFIFLELM